jgi:type IV pilus assembly protein PilM
MNLRLSLREGSPPTVAVELAAHRVSAVVLETRGDRPVVTAHASETLAPGVLAPSLTAVNIRDRQAVAAALARVFERIGSRPRRIGLVVPDAIAKVSLVRFEQVPARSQELEQLVRWQIRKAAPFPIEEAQVSFVRGLRAADGQEFIVALAKRQVLQEYEQLCADAGAHAGIVDLATFGLVNVVLAGGTMTAGDWLLVNVTPVDASIAIVRGAHLIFFRNRSEEGEGGVADLVHQTAMYYEDRLQGTGFGRVILAGLAGTADDVRGALEKRLSAPVEVVDPTAAAGLTDRISGAPALLETLAPMVGLLLRDRPVHAAARQES